MTAIEDEVPLTGGNITAGVFRVGNTVRRTVGPHSASIHRLLRHLENAGYSKCPRFLGHDEKGREILTFLDGSSDFTSSLWQNEDAVVAGATMLREYHDAVAGFSDFDPDNWAYAYPDPARHEVICHNDFAPYNMVFKSGLPVGVIDFDLAGPGPRLRDVAYLAYWLTPLSFSSEEMLFYSRQDVATGSRRLKLLCQTYDTENFPALLEMVADVLQHMGDKQIALSMVGEAAVSKLENGGHFEFWQREAAAFGEQRRTILSNLR